MMFPYPPSPDIDMSTWQRGPWDSEPSAISWVDGRTGLNCAMIRHHEFGTWCGYVAIEPGHPLHGLKYSDRIKMPPGFLEQQAVMGRDFGVIDLFINGMEGLEDGKASVGLILPAHGGITYSGEDENGFWWFGFDTCHMDDMQPGMAAIMKSAGIENSVLGRGFYRDQGYVHGIVTRLAWALHEARGMELAERPGSATDGA